MTRTCPECGDLVVAEDHINVGVEDKRTVEIQECINCNWTTQVTL